MAEGQQTEIPRQFPNVTPDISAASAQNRQLVRAVDDCLKELRDDLKEVKSHRHTDLLYVFGIFAAGFLGLATLSLVLYSKLDSKLDEKYLKLDSKIDEKYLKLDSKLDDKYSKLDSKLDDKYSKLDSKLDDKYSKLDSKLDDKYSKLDDKLNGMISSSVRIDTKLEDLLARIPPVPTPPPRRQNR